MWQTAPSAGMLALGMATGRTGATSLLAPQEEPQLSVTATSWFSISNPRELQICFSELYWPVPLLGNTNSSNTVENEQLTWLRQTWRDYCTSAELFFWDKNSSAGMKAFICQTLLQLKWRTRAITSQTHAYLHQLKEAWVQHVHMRTLLICQHQCEQKRYQLDWQEEE